MTSNATAESKFVEVNGLRLHYLDWGNSAAPALVCVHGLRNNAHAFDGLARRFRDRFHVLCLDVRGRGDSAWSPNGAYSYADYVSDLEGFIAALGIERFTLIGTSMGGRIGMYYAGRNAARLDRLVLNDIGPDAESGSERITREAALIPATFATLDDYIEYRSKALPRFAALSHEDKLEEAATFIRQQPDGAWVWKHDPEFLRQRTERGTPSSSELWDVLARLDVPTLLVWGSASDVLSEAQAKRVVAALPRGSMATVPGSPHAPTLNEDAAVEALEHFLSQPAATRAG